MEGERQAAQQPDLTVALCKVTARSRVAEVLALGPSFRATSASALEWSSSLAVGTYPATFTQPCEMRCEGYHGI